MVDILSPALARRIALAAQGFGRPAPAQVGTRQLNRTIQSLGLLQLDSVNVFERSHYLPLFARLGAYDKTVLDALTFGRRGPYIEYWAHEAAIIPVDSWPLMRWRMRALRDKDEADVGHWMHSHRRMMQWLHAEVAEKGPLPASAVEHDAKTRSGPWWGWSDVKTGLEVLFRHGELVSAGRRGFERVYARPEQVLSPATLDREVSRADAQRELVSRAARALGVATASDLADYYRLRTDATLTAVRDLEDSGELLPVTVLGWNRRAWLHRDARLPRPLSTMALLSPFDPVVWERDRAERMFGFRYRIEIYTPAPKRVFGYYTLPLLQDDGLVGRIDLKSDRQNGVLRVQSAWREAGAIVDLERLRSLLARIAEWQGLATIVIVDRGDLARELAAAMGVQVVAPS